MHRVLLSCCLFALALPAASPVDFNRQVRPILSENCFACHGPDEKQRMANLRLDTEQGLAAAKEKIVARISPGAKPQPMPPPSTGKKLTEQQIAVIRDWVAQGAKWQRHWAYSPPERPEPPAVKNARWPRNDIDRFILSKLGREGLKPSPEADRVTLIRRLTLDLTGLPPTPEEVDQFLADRSPNAWDKQVDRLLASPRYGERMAMQWLDLARYADTHGYHIDSHRDMWHWRDWVIDAFNGNIPFDRFTVEQLAGDLLPNATVRQRIATGFNRNHMINFEGGAIPEEYQAEYVMDRVDTTATVWMATTMGCARCHDHKYDPVSQRDYYRMFAFFNTIGEKGLDGRTGNADPILELPSEPQAQAMARLKSAIGEREGLLFEPAVPKPDVEKLPEPSEPTKAVLAALAEWEKDRLEKFPQAAREGLVAHYGFDGNLGDSSGRYQTGRVLRGDVGYPASPVDRAAGFSGETEVRLGDGGGFDKGGAFSMAFWVRTTGTKPMALLQKGEAFSIAFGEFHKAPDLKRSGPMYLRIGGMKVAPKPELLQREWRHVALAFDGGTVRLWIDGKPVESEVTGAAGTFASNAPLAVARTYKGDLDELRIYRRALADAEVDVLAVREPARAALIVQSARRTKDQATQLREYFLTHEAPEPFQTAWRELVDLKAQRTALLKEVPTVMVMAEMKKPRDTFILGRGDYRNRGDKVTAAVPSMLPPLPADAPNNRLGLAKWLVSGSHPLTARVAVNRYWQTYFGLGLVKTSEDFGSQGEVPAHRELLDWLATEFVRSGWDVKAMQRLILTSATYRQSSRVPPGLLEKDPENRLLARGPRYRLPAETLRDNALAASGLLNDAIGGPAVYPYQPKGVWEELAYGDVYSAQEYEQSHGRDLYRRSMYTFWKRTAPPPAMMAFDAPDREKCTARRLVTNTPLQALVLLNDPTYVEAARALAERAIAGARSPRQRLELAFRLATARKPNGKEAAVLLALERKKLADYRRDPEAARKLVAVGESAPGGKLDPVELAAWTTVTGVILNLDETISKE